MLAPGAHAATTDDVVRHAELIVLTIPMHRFRDLASGLFAGKILVDAMNYWEETDGVDEDLATATMGTSLVVQQHFPLARVVKSLNHLGYFKFEQGRRPRGAPNRLAVAAAGNDPVAVAAVMRLIVRLGFDAVYAGSLNAGMALQPSGPVFGTGLNADTLTKLLPHKASPAREAQVDLEPFRRQMSILWKQKGCDPGNAGTGNTFIRRTGTRPNLTASFPPTPQSSCGTGCPGHR